MIADYVHNKARKLSKLFTEIAATENPILLAMIFDDVKIVIAQIYDDGRQEEISAKAKGAA